MTAKAISALAFAPAAKPPKQTPRPTGLSTPIALRGLCKSFGAKRVLQDVELDVPAGQFLAIAGRSGCGKSTLLRLIVGLDTPTAGTISVGGACAGDGRIMFQEPRLLPWARVADNVRVGLAGVELKEDARAAALEALDEVGLADRAGDWPSVLSGGQKQRVALARALVSRPRLLALDEPLGALDALTRIEMQALIERVWREQGFTAVLVTHDVSEALALADRVVVIEDGRVALDLDVDLPRPRQRGSVEIGRLEAAILDQLFSAGGRPSDDQTRQVEQKDEIPEPGIAEPRRAYA